jgi:hypothetical protein
MSTNYEIVLDFMEGDIRVMETTIKIYTKEHPTSTRTHTLKVLADKVKSDKFINTYGEAN